MRWTVHDERSLYESEQVLLRLAHVELPDGRRFDHHVVRFPHEAVGVVVRDPERGVLLIRRHRFITDSWGWEIPAGKVEPGESLDDAARREALEETGWRPGPIRQLFRYDAAVGMTDARFNIAIADRAEFVGDPVDAHEAERVDWMPVGDVRDLLRAGEVRDGLSLTALVWALAFEL